MPRHLLCFFSLIIWGFFVIGSVPLYAQDDEIEEIGLDEIEEVGDASNSLFWDHNSYAMVDRTVNILSAEALPKGALLFVVDHRADEKISEDPFHDFFGFDSGALKIGLGLRYGLWDHLEIGAYRLSGSSAPFDIYEFDCKYQVLNQEKLFLDMALRGGVTWFSQYNSFEDKNVEDASGYFGQLLVQRAFARWLKLGTGLLYHSDSSYPDTKTTADEDYSLAVPFTLSVRPFGFLSWNLEVVSGVAGFKEDQPAISTSLKMISFRHTFSLIVTNTREITADGIVAQSHRKLDEALLGFSITREF